MLELDTHEAVQIRPRSSCFSLLPYGRHIVTRVAKEYGKAKNATRPTVFALLEFP